MSYSDVPRVVITIQIDPVNRQSSHRGGWVATHPPQTAKVSKRPKQREYHISNMLRDVQSLNNYRAIDQALIDLVIKRGNEHPLKVWKTIRGLRGYLKSGSLANQFLSVKEIRDLIFHSIDQLQPPRDNNITMSDTPTRGLTKKLSGGGEVQLRLALF